MSFPFDFGLIPSTCGEDGDPLDVLVLLDEPVPAGCIVPSRLIGVIDARQSEEDGRDVENTALHSPSVSGAELFGRRADG